MLDASELALSSFKQAPEIESMIPANLVGAMNAINNFLAPYSELLRKIAKGTATSAQIEHANLRKGLLYHARQRRMKKAAFK